MLLRPHTQRARELFGRARPAYSELLHPHLQGAAFQPKEHGCALRTADYPIGCLKSVEDVPPLHVFQSLDLAGFSVGERICWHGGLRLRLQIAEWHVEHSTCGQNHGALDEILQLANVPRPMVGDQNIHGFRRNRVDLPVHAPRKLPGKVPDQQRNILAAIPERRQQNRKNIQAIKQVGSELMVRNHFREIAVCRRNQTSVALQRTRAPEPLELALLQNAQQLRLQFQRYFADLVQENRSTAREFKAPDALRDRAGESASLMAEDLAFEQSRWNRRAVQFDERILRTRT